MSELSDLYQEVILDHSRHPHNYHAMADASRQAKGHNPICGDQVTIYVKLDGDKTSASKVTAAPSPNPPLRS